MDMMPDEENNSVEEGFRVSALLISLQEKGRLFCTDCSSEICTHEYILNIIMGLKDAPRCVSCLSSSLGRDQKGFIAQIMDYISDKVCYRTGWDWSSDQEGFHGEGIPPCLLTKKEMEESKSQQGDATSESSSPVIPVPDAEWDAGDLGCGDLVMQLRIRLQSMKPGSVLALTARDPGAPVDLPAWCGLTGHTLLSANHPVYLIRRNCSSHDPKSRD